MTIKPLGDRILVKAVEEGEQVRGGIIIPDTAKEKPQQGVVLAVGPGRINDSGETVAMNVAVGDKVLYGKYSGTEITIEGVKNLIMRESDVLGIIES